MRFLFRSAVLAAIAAITASPAPAQVFLYEPTLPSGPIEPSDPIVGIALPGATPAEFRAHLLWNLRSGLNVAALSCQFSPFLRTVDNYNAVIDHHSAELANAYRTLEGYFRRVNGRTGMTQLDNYSTSTAQAFATIQAQFGFCQTAARIGKEALARRQGELHLVASARMRELRASLEPIQEPYTFLRIPVQLTPINLADCSRLSGRERRDCSRALRGD
jgi:hypothetical protein